MIYAVHQSDGYEDYGYVLFDNEAMAQKYCDVQKELYPEDTWYIVPKKINKFDLDTKVVDYYSFYIGKEPEYTLENIIYNKSELKCYFKYILGMDSELINNEDSLDNLLNTLSDEQKQEMLAYHNKLENRYDNDEETEKKIYEGDLIIEDLTDYIRVFSVNSFEEAKEEALKLYEEWKQFKV